MLHPPAVSLQYFLCIITQFKDCYKLYRLALLLLFIFGGGKLIYCPAATHTVRYSVSTVRATTQVPEVR